MENQIIQISTDWWMFGAGIFAGVVTALSTLGAVIYSNRKTIQQLRIQKEEHEKEKLESFKSSKMVIVKPALRCVTFMDVLDEMVSSNNWERRLLLSGDDGFDFFDDQVKLASQKTRVLKISNVSYLDVTSIKLSTHSVLRNLNNEKKLEYSTVNNIRFLRGGEDVVIRLLNQSQLDYIVEMNNAGTPSDFDFTCEISYTTLAKQRVNYVYKINIKNDKRIEVKEDGVENIVDNYVESEETPTIFRNLQDYISGVDRVGYHWEKVGKAQAKGMFSLLNFDNAQKNEVADADADADVKEENK